MTPSAVAKLVEKWRPKDAHEYISDGATRDPGCKTCGGEYYDAVHRMERVECANELEAALSQERQVAATVWIVLQNGHVHSVHASRESAEKEQGKNLLIDTPWAVLQDGKRFMQPALATAPPEQAAPRIKERIVSREEFNDSIADEAAQSCVDWNDPERRKEALRYIVKQIWNEAITDQPQPASAGALSESMWPENLTICSKCNRDMLTNKHAVDIWGEVVCLPNVSWREQTLAAHDQKVRAEATTLRHHLIRFNVSGEYICECGHVAFSRDDFDAHLSKD